MGSPQKGSDPRIISEISQYIQYYHYNIERFVRSLVSGYKFVLGKQGYPAYMNHTSKTITLNSDGIAMILEPFYQMIKSLDYYKQQDFYYKFSCGLALHECFHVKYTPPPSRIAVVAKEENIKSPDWWYIWVVNVVDDSFIQNKGRQDYPGLFVNECLSYVETVVQGMPAVEEFSKRTEHDVKSMLFYLVLLSYNRMIEKPDAVKIPDELINEFLSIYYIDDDEERTRHTLQFADKLLDVLFDETEKEMKKLKITVTNKPQPQSDEEEEDVNLDDYDEIEIDFDIDPDLEDDKDESNDGQGQSGQGDSEESEGEEESEDDAKGSSSQPTDEKADEDSPESEETGKGIGTGSGDGQTPEDYTPEDVMNYLKDIVEELSQQDLTQSEGEADESIFKDNNALDRAMVANGVGRADKTSHRYPLTNFATDVHGFFMQEFKRIQAFTFNKTVYYQPTGKFNNADAFRTNYSKNVFRQRFEPKRDMDLFTGIILDASGSMSSRVAGNATLYDVMSDIIIGLMDSLEKVKAKTEMLVFDERSIKVKDYYTNIDLENMNAQIKQAYHSLGGGTDIYESLAYFYNAFKVKPHKDKCLIVFTDGSTDHIPESSDLIMGMKRQGVLVIGIGLRLDSYDLSYFERLFSNCEHKNYETLEDIRINIARDLRELLSNTFMKNNI